MKRHWKLGRQGEHYSRDAGMRFKMAGLGWWEEKSVNEEIVQCYI